MLPSSLPWCPPMDNVPRTLSYSSGVLVTVVALAECSYTTIRISSILHFLNKRAPSTLRPPLIRISAPVCGGVSGTLENSPSLTLTRVMNPWDHGHPECQGFGATTGVKAVGAPCEGRPHTHGLSRAICVTYPRPHGEGPSLTQRPPVSLVI